MTTSAFAHHEADAGVPRHHRVVARRGDQEGLPSNEASVYVQVLAAPGWCGVRIIRAPTSL